MRRNTPNDFPPQAFDTDVSGPQSSRRTASPVRLTLASALGGEIDGAWWPRTGAMVRELPDLVLALHPALGEIVDISINWAAGSAIPILSTSALMSNIKLGTTNAPRYRLMAVCGRTASARLLVVPPMTPAALALMVLRQASARHIPELDRGTAAYEAADRVVRACRAESALWEAEQPDQNLAGPSTTTEKT